MKPRPRKSDLTATVRLSPDRTLHPLYRNPADARWCLYLSGPMTGIPLLNFPAFELAAMQLRAVGHRVMSPHESIVASAAPWETHLRADIGLLLRCTAVATLPDAACSKGARLETMIAHQLGMPIYGVDRWLDLDRPLVLSPAPTLGASM